MVKIDASLPLEQVVEASKAVLFDRMGLAKWNKKNLKAWQPDQFDRFVRILEQDQLNHAYLFSGFFGIWKWRNF